MHAAMAEPGRGTRRAAGRARGARRAGRCRPSSAPLCRIEGCAVPVTIRPPIPAREAVLRLHARCQRLCGRTFRLATSSQYRAAAFPSSLTGRPPTRLPAHLRAGLRRDAGARPIARGARPIGEGR
ncbi:hypothetical protein Wenmar_04110 (plasmid) [Wenxinia marina DSM 24838]|uniref:Uncharacterized protein n=1 Tax=Wenxinia marina DSM 24838 TaxID=1123501 RepID=A0A0D0NT78_9RHOB|nr:hypothetical protein Wenmar_04110 [Wenxinia marina DSM 24838]